MKKRLRKKRHLGEFAVLGVSLRAQFAAGLAEQAFDAFIDGFIEEAVEKEGLSFGGGGSPLSGWSGVVEPPHHSRHIDSEFLARFTAWLSSRTELQSFEVSEPWDLWHGSNPFDEDVIGRHSEVTNPAPVGPCT